MTDFQVLYHAITTKNEQLKAVLNQFEYDYDGNIKRFPSESEVKEALKELF